MEFNFVPDMPELTFSMFIAPYRAHLMGFYIVVIAAVPGPLIALPVGSCSQLSRCRISKGHAPLAKKTRAFVYSSVSLAEINIRSVCISFLLSSLFGFVLLTFYSKAK